MQISKSRQRELSPLSESLPSFLSSLYQSAARVLFFLLFLQKLDASSVSLYLSRLAVVYPSGLLKLATCGRQQLSILSVPRSIFLTSLAFLQRVDESVSKKKRQGKSRSAGEERASA